MSQSLNILLELNETQLDHLENLMDLLEKIGYSALKWNRVTRIQELINKGELPVDTLSLFEGNLDRLEYLKTTQGVGIGLVPNAKRISFANAVKIAQTPEITPENIDWIDNFLAKKSMRTIAKNVFKEGKKFNVYLAALVKIIKNKEKIRSNYQAIVEHGDNLIQKLGIEGQWNYKLKDPLDLLAIGKGSTIRFLDEVKKLPTEKQAPIIHLGALQTYIGNYNDNSRKLFEKCITRPEEEKKREEAALVAKQGLKTEAQAFKNKFPNIILDT